MIDKSDLKKFRLLVVDDDDDFRDAIAFSFRRLGCEVLTASNGREGFNLAQTEKPDVIISDIRMPGGDGVEFLDRVRASSPDTPVILLITGFAEAGTEEILDKGAEALISKPFHPKVLQETILRLLTPSPERWVRIDERYGVHFDIKLNVEGMDKAIDAKVLNVGRGGLFVALPAETFPSVNAYVNFAAQFDDESTFEGSGIVRWVRPKDTPEFPSGCGLEFISLGTKERQWMMEFIRSHKVRSYIPKK